MMEADDTELDPPATEPNLNPRKLDRHEAILRAPRPKPARYNRKIVILFAGSAAAVTAGALLAPSLLSSVHKDGPPPPAPTSFAASAPIEPISYGTAPAESSSGAPGLDCSQYPGMPGCAAQNAAAAATPPTAASNVHTPPGDEGAAQASSPASLSKDSSAPGAPAPGNAARPSNVFFGGENAPSPRGSPPAAGAAMNADVRAASGASPAITQVPFPSPLARPFGALGAKEGDQTADVMAQNGQAEKAAFIRAGASQDYVETRLQKPRSPYEIKAGTVISAALLTAINSDLPGEVIAQVSTPVYDHATSRFVLIPQGARLIGRYDAQVAYGQIRALIVWRRLIFPNGDSLNLGAMAATDGAGAAGLSDQVNDHFGQLAKGIVISTLLSMGLASAQDAEARSSGTLVLNAGESGLANQAQSVGSRIANRDLGRQPTLQIRQGAEVRLLVDKDLILEPYH